MNKLRGAVCPVWRARPARTGHRPVRVEAQLHFDVWMGDPEDGFERFAELLGLEPTSCHPAPPAISWHWAPTQPPTCRPDLRPPLAGASKRPCWPCTVGLHHDPFAAPAVRADLATAPQWAAELARVRGEDTVDGWLAAVGSWDHVARPHDAAYCRWRAAQVALREGQGTVAARLLKKAALDAREHVPLSQAIAATAAGAR